MRMVAIGVQHDRPVLIGPEDLGTDVAVAPHHRRRRVAECITPPNTDDRDVRRQRLQERQRARRGASGDAEL
jgi:hypothetical protein